MSQLYLYIFESLFVLLQRTTEIYLAVDLALQLALEFYRGQYCAQLMVCYNSNTKNDLVKIAHVCTSHYVHFLLGLQQIQKTRMLAVQCCKMGIDGP